MFNLRTRFSQTFADLDVTRVYCRDVIRGSCRVFRSSTTMILARLMHYVDEARGHYSSTLWRECIY